MKSRIFIISVFAMLFCCTVNDAEACGPYEYDAAEYLLFRVYDPAERSICKRVIEQLQPSDDPEVIEYLEMARKCEMMREKMNDPWYYPSKNDTVRAALEEVLQKSLSYDGKALADRYALQAARAMFTLGEFEQMCKWWEKMDARIPDGAIRDHIVGYVAGAMFRTGSVEEALNYYAAVGDVESIMYCLKKENRYDGYASIQEYCDERPEVLAMLQKDLGYIELYYGYYSSREKKRISDHYLRSMTIAQKSENPGPWLYAAAFIKYLSGEYNTARRIIQMAEGCDNTDFIDDSVKVLRILLDAQLSAYNSGYETKLFEDLMWLDQKICDNLTEEIRQETAENPYLMKNNLSYYYWNDMMRKIVLGTVVPKMHKAGKTPLAILLANYADNRLISLVDMHPCPSWWEGADSAQGKSYSDYRKSSLYKLHDYSNVYFRLMTADDTDVSHVIGYAEKLSDPKDGLEKFLVKRSFVDYDYIYDVIGTKYLRSCQYEEARSYLVLVSRSYQNRLNTSQYMRRMPFKYNRTLSVKEIPDYKLSFAKEMIACEEIIANSSDPDEVGNAKIKYGIGMKNSMDYCWALTQYVVSSGFPNSSHVSNDHTKKYIAKGERNISSGLAMQTNGNHCDVLANYL